MPAKTSKLENQLLQIKVTLLGTKPPIWRRLLIPGNLKLSQLHEVIQTAMSWLDYHLHEFQVGTQTFGISDEDSPDNLDESKTQVSKVLRAVGARARYTYDFGDDWEHTIVVEKIIAPEPGVTYPICTAGKRSGPPEDCGGPGGYQHLLQILKNPKHPEYREMKEWLPDDFDSEEFSIDDINKQLASMQKA